MSRPTCPSRRHLLLVAFILGCAGQASAETLRCRSVNGNVTCAGSGAASCQTVDGRTTCVSGDGGVVQQFGYAKPPAGMEELHERDAAPPPPRPMRRRLSIERQGPAGHLTLERDGSGLRLRTERPDLDDD